ncbi:PhzF family phenazine biosynthesis protein [uncultured Tateyamaria sp.]|uniref:PhzF family phenazine biosynthesis protein n=1 Tax=uncultured Tateyamaria sp. TaxID=455651 RepID=UPI00262BCCEC|nr:PhzF family phenazine biosynthesis protein [uncultured Tateyamaria sp.]
MTFNVDWVDAFTDRAFGGNGCAVVHDGAGLDDDICMAFVRETSLVECTFTGPSDVADIRVRYFLASREIPFAGHPTVATVAALRHRNLIEDGSLTLETGAGVVPVEADGMSIRMTQVAPNFGARPDPALVAAVGGLTADDIVHPPRVTSTGLPFAITVLKDRATLDRVRFNLDAFETYLAALGVHGTDVMEPFWCTREGATHKGDTFARLLMAPPSPAEDPFTGSATGAMAAYLWSEGLIEMPHFTAEQGHGLGRPGQARVSVQGPRDAITGVVVEGQAHVLMSGQLRL